MYLVSYDISEDKLRNKVAKELKNYGIRVQYSVFECNLTSKRYQELYQKLVKLVSGQAEDSIRVYYICAGCQEKMSCIGNKLEKLEILSQDTIVI